MVNRLLLIGLLLTSPGLMADTSFQQSNIGGLDKGHIESETVKLDQTDYQAKLWNINSEDWTRYEIIMRDKGKFFWKHLDPIIVLGLNARNVKERKRFAKLMAIQEYQNGEKLILLDREYSAAFKEMYGHIPMMDLSRRKDKNSITTFSNKSVGQINAGFGDRYIAFVNTDCSACNALIQEVLSKMELGVSVDIHFKNDGRKAITQWASQQGISPDSVAAGSITLNPDSALYAKFNQPAQPALYFFNNTLNQVNEVK